jgi:DNA helicase IV
MNADISVLILVIILLWWLSSFSGKTKQESTILVTTPIELEEIYVSNISKACDAFRGFLDGSDYFNHAKLRFWKDEYSETYEKIKQGSAFQISNWEDEFDAFKLYFSDCEDLREEYNTNYVQSELKQHSYFFDTIAGYPLTQEQRVAIVTGEDNCYLNSGAGCGKTSTIIGRLGYLVKIKGVEPSRVLALAFNTSAAEEVRQRLSSLEVEGVDVSTFHSFGRKVIGIARQGMPDLTFVEPGDSREQFIEKSFKQLTTENPKYQKKVIRYFMRYLTEHKPLEDFESLNECLKYENGGNLRSTNGIYMKSQQEVAIADFLYEHSVNFEYEKRYEFDTATATHRQYRPDFYLTDYDIWLEHFAIKKGSSGQLFSIFKGYMDGHEWKMKVHAEKETQLLSTFSYQFDDDTIWDSLRESLEEQGVQLAERPSGELARTILNDRPQMVSKFTNLLSTFMSLMTSAGKSVEELKAGLLSFRNQAFLDIVQPIYHTYRKELERRDAIDFDDMIANGAEALGEGSCLVEYDHVLIDEFQDIGIGRLKLVKGVIGQNPGSRVFCVGDDWQAIYRFAGGDVSILYDFEEYFEGECVRLNLTKTFRYSDEVASLSNDFVLKNPRQTRKTVTSDSDSQACIDIRNKPSADDTGTIKLNSGGNHSVCTVGGEDYQRPDP